MSNQITILINPFGSYYFCLRLKKEGFHLYEFDQLTSNRDAITDNNSRLIGLSSHGGKDGIVIQAIYNGEELPDIFTRLLDTLIRIPHIAKISWNFEKS